jgi:hypothetical protein
MAVCYTARRLLSLKGERGGEGGEGLSLAKMTIHSLKLNSRRDHKSIHYSFLSLKKKKRKTRRHFLCFSYYSNGLREAEKKPFFKIFFIIRIFLILHFFSFFLNLRFQSPSQKYVCRLVYRGCNSSTPTRPSRCAELDFSVFFPIPISNQST